MKSSIAILLLLVVSDVHLVNCVQVTCDVDVPGLNGASAAAAEQQVNLQKELSELKIGFEKLFKLATELQNNLTASRQKQSRLEQELNSTNERLLILENASSAGEACPVGIADSDVIRDDQLSASSVYDHRYTPQHGRLHSSKGAGAWTVSRGNRRVGQWLQVDLGKSVSVIAVATQGSYLNPFEYVTSYKIEHKLYGSHRFRAVRDDQENIKIFTGNANGESGTVVKHSFDAAVTGRYFRIIPLTWNNWPSLRFELYTC